ncbi:hypothetical protein IFM89_017918, partial [Coptis chinensis]
TYETLTSKAEKYGNLSSRVTFADKVRGEQPHQLNTAELPTPEVKGRIDFQKIKLEEVKKIAQAQWKPKGHWKIVPLGKGFFMIRLTCEEDLRNIWGGGPWKFGDQVKVPKLGQQHWDYEILMSIARELGNPVGVDKHILSKEYGYFAQVLVEIDLASPIPEKICVEEDASKSFLQEVVVGKLPKFCSHTAEL